MKRTLRTWRWKVAWKFDPHDLWVGVFWTTEGAWVKVFICLIPTLPLCVRWLK